MENDIKNAISEPLLAHFSFDQLPDKSYIKKASVYNLLPKHLKFNTDNLENHKLLYFILRSTFQWQPKKTNFFFRKIIPISIVIFYLISLINSYLTPLWFSPLVNATYPRQLILVQFFLVLSPLVSFSFTSLIYFPNGHFFKFLNALKECRLKSHSIFITKTIYFFCILFFCILLFLLATVIGLAIVLATSQYYIDDVTIYTKLFGGFSVFLWALYFITTIYIGSGSVLSIMFLVFLICVLVKKELNCILNEVKLGSVTEEVITDYNNISFIIDLASQKLQLGYSLVTGLPLISFIIHIYTIASFGFEPFEVGAFNGLFYFAFFQNLAFLFLLMLTLKAAADLAQTSQNFAFILSNTIFTSDNINFDNKLIAFINTISNEYTRSGFRLFGSLITRTTFTSIFFTLFSAVMIIIQGYLFSQN
eukprot:TRINITY_DN1213_c2_g1_i1.p1 TRINITY_DN1213_c2_g1~~TRINITY_DN1213_c2_g1_i1.p1  ORF type:complete len:421 (+),score=26.13 TRINITY_DN1213_c2_g1_i1:121-1383(+)